MDFQYIPIAELQSGSKILAVYLLGNVQVRPKKDGSNFVSMVLKDATGKITGVMWDNFTALSSGAIKENDYVEVGGEISIYNGQPQMRVQRIRRLEDSQVDTTFFLPHSPRNLDEMIAEFWGYVEEVEDEDFHGLLELVFKNEVFWQKFIMAPSAVSMHQAYLNGLIDHTLCVTRNALKMADNYPVVNRDMLITGALLHDTGKIVEFNYDRKIAYSDAGRLLGHISIGNAMIELHCHNLPDFPMEKKILLQHMILSHHGLLEYGSPRCPATMEALILHHADLLDAQMSNFVEYKEHAARTGTRWEYNAMFERHMFAGDDIIDETNTASELAESFHQQFAQMNNAADSVEPSGDLLENNEKNH